MDFSILYAPQLQKQTNKKKKEQNKVMFPPYEAIIILNIIKSKGY